MAPCSRGAVPAVAGGRVGSAGSACEAEGSGGLAWAYELGLSEEPRPSLRAEGCVSEFYQMRLKRW